MSYLVREHVPLADSYRQNPRMADEAPRAQRVALLAGGSGLVGSELLRLLLMAADYSRIYAVSRRPLPFDNPRLANRIVPLEETSARLTGVHCDDAFCCIGSTRSSAGSAAEREKVDLDLVRELCACRAGVRRHRDSWSLRRRAPIPSPAIPISASRAGSKWRCGNCASRPWRSCGRACCWVRGRSRGHWNWQVHAGHAAAQSAAVRAACAVARDCRLGRGCGHAGRGAFPTTWCPCLCRPAACRRWRCREGASLPDALVTWRTSRPPACIVKWGTIPDRTQAAMHSPRAAIFNGLGRRVALSAATCGLVLLLAFVWLDARHAAAPGRRKAAGAGRASCHARRRGVGRRIRSAEVVLRTLSSAQGTWANVPPRSGVSPKPPACFPG